MLLLLSSCLCLAVFLLTRAQTEVICLSQNGFSRLCRLVPDIQPQGGAAPLTPFPASLRSSSSVRPEL